MVSVKPVLQWFRHIERIDGERLMKQIYRPTWRVTGGEVNQKEGR